MAAPLSASRLVAALHAEGVRVVEHRSWRTHNRNHVGAWGPVHGVMIHHTVTSGTDASVRLCYDGHSSLPGPLCHGVIAKDGTVYLVGNGRANHAGSGDGGVLQAVIDERPLPPDRKADTDGNARFYGFECVNLGDNKDPWPAVQVEAIVRASAAILRAHSWGKSGDTSVIGHSEWQPGKIDPRGPGISMGDIRRRVAERLKHPADWSPGGSTNPPSEEDEVPKRALYETSSDHTHTLPRGEWVTLTFDRIYSDGKWVKKKAEQTVLKGAAFYSGGFAIRVAPRSLAPGAEVQMRLGHNRRNDAGEWERGARMPISSPVHDAGSGHHTYTWQARIGGSRDDRLVCEVLVPGKGDPVTVEWARAELLYWED